MEGPDELRLSMQNVSNPCPDRERGSKVISCEGFDVGLKVQLKGHS